MGSIADGPVDGLVDGLADDAGPAEQSIEANARVLAVADPPAHCPACLAEAGQMWPLGATTRHCPAHLEQLRRRQVQGWNADPAHQARAGQASWSAFSARWRAGQGLPPLSAEAARRYVTPDLIRGPCCALLPPALRAAIHRAWCAGRLPDVAAWLSDAPPPEPDGLWAAAVADQDR